MTVINYGVTQSPDGDGRVRDPLDDESKTILIHIAATNISLKKTLFEL